VNVTLYVWHTVICLSVQRPVNVDHRGRQQMSCCRSEKTFIKGAVIGKEVWRKMRVSDVSRDRTSSWKVKTLLQYLWYWYKISARSSTL